MSLGMLGKHHSEKTKKKMRRARLERKKLLGYINSPETRKKISEAQKFIIIYMKARQSF